MRTLEQNELTQASGGEGNFVQDPPWKLEDLIKKVHGSPYPSGKFPLPIDETPYPPGTIPDPRMPPTDVR